MIIIVLVLLLIASFLYNPRRFPYSLVVYFVFFDMFDGFYEENKVFSGIRYLVPLVLMSIYCLKNGILKKIDFIFFLLGAYLLSLWLLNSGDLMVSSRYVLAVFITFLMIPIGKHLGSKVDFIEEFEGYNRLLLIAIPVYIIYANIAGIGGYYTEAFSTGFLVTSRIYIVPIVVFLAIHYTVAKKDNNWLIRTSDVVFIMLNVCLMLINTRRTALGMLLGAIFIYVLINRRMIFKVMLFMFVMVGVLIASYPLYEARLTAQLEKRERIQHLDTYEEEKRVLETLYLLDYHKNRGSIPELLFGVKLFDTYDFGIMYFGRDRPIHSDINMIFFSTGLIGVLLFAVFFLHYFFRRNDRILKSDRQIYYPILIMFLIVLIPGRFISTLTYAPLLMLVLSSLKPAFHTFYIEEAEDEDLIPAVSEKLMLQ